MKKRILKIMIVAAALTMLSACGSDDKNSQSTQSSGIVVGTATTAPTENAASSDTTPTLAPNEKVITDDPTDTPAQSGETGTSTDPTVPDTPTEGPTEEAGMPTPEGTSDIPTETPVNNTDTPTPTVETPAQPISGDAIPTRIPSSGGFTKTSNGLYLRNGAAYAMCGYVPSMAQLYGAALESAAQKLAGTTNVYNILVPNSSAVELTAEERAQLGGSDEQVAIDGFASYMPSVHSVKILSTMRQHSNEYLFFRTDHHWTQHGAYYAYLCYCQEKGFTPIPLSSRKMYTFPNFLGSYYSDYNDPQMAANPDTVYAYCPVGTNSMTYTDANGNTINYYVVADVTGVPALGYCSFVAGDQPYAVVHNPNITDGSSCAIIKESYGNPFCPFMVDHYEYVYMFDVRYTKTNVLSFCKEHNVTDLIVINNLIMATSTYTANRLSTILS